MKEYFTITSNEVTGGYKLSDEELCEMCQYKKIHKEGLCTECYELCQKEL